MFKKIKIFILSCFCLMVAVPAVWATWHFYSSPQAHSTDLSVKTGTWPTDVVLPSTPQDTEIGGNYKMLLDAILDSSKAGLNPTDVLEDAIWNTKKNSHHLGLLYSSQNITGGNQSHLFDKDTNAGTASLLFAIESIEKSKTEYYVYLYKKSDAEDAVLQNNLSKEPISAYRIMLKKENGTWSAHNPMLGSAYVYRPTGDYFNGIKTSTWQRN